MIRILLVVFGLLLQINQCFGQADEFEDRIEKYVLAIDELQDTYSVTTKSDVVLDFGVTDRIAFERRTAMYFWDSTANVSRFHGRVIADMNGRELAFHYHAGRFDEECFVSGASPTARNIPIHKVEHIENRGGVTELPFEILPFCNFNALATGRRVVESTTSELLDAKWLGGNYDKERRYVCTVLFKAGYGGARITFKADPNWLPEKVEYISHPKFKRVNVGNAKLSSLDEWRVRSRTLCTWEQIGITLNSETKKVWVPQLLSTSERQLNGTDFRSWDMAFVDWQFPPKVDKALGDVKSFSSQYISRIDFEDMEAKADKLLDNIHNANRGKAAEE